MSKTFALDFLMSRPWALDQSYLDIMASLSARDIDNLDLSALKIPLSGVADGVNTALEGKTGRNITQALEIRDNVAVIHVNGVISRYASIFEDICGGTSTQNLAKNWTIAQERHDVESIVLYINSPGGEADGIHEFADMVFSARGDKRVIAYVGGSACSAAYWIASAADEVVIDATARLGSIGTVMNIRRRKVSNDDPIETLEIVSAVSPNKRLDPFKEEGRDAYQKEIDQLADIFVDRVASYMGVKRQTVLDDFGAGGVLIGQNAVDKGMAHRLGSFEGVISELQNRKQQPMSKEKKTAAQGGDENTVLSLGLPSLETASAQDVITAITSERPDVIQALTPETPKSALDDAAAIATACSEAGVPAMSATLLKPGVTQAAAMEKIKAAGNLKTTLAAAGIDGSFDALVGAVDDPVKLAGLVAHEVAASFDESSDTQRQVVTETGKKTAYLSTKDIYANR